MGIKVTVNSIPKSRVSINSTTRETIRSVGISPSQATDKYFSGLLDVDVTGASNNDTVVYDSAAGKYVVKELPILNGGTF